MTLICLSPHLDDAVFSCGDYLSTRDDVIVLTLFAGAPPDDVTLTDWDRTCGFQTSRQAWKARVQENRSAVETIGAAHCDANFCDHAYRQPPPVDLGAWLDGYLLDTDDLLIPVGIEHPDHIATHTAGMAVAHRANRVGAYADLPYAAAYPDRATPPDGYTVAEPWGGDTAAKRAAVACYRSQLPAVERMGSVCVEERVWWRP